MDELRFGPFHVAKRGRVLATEHGPVALGARAFDLLIVLAERAGRLVSKHELLDLVWPGQAVEEGNLHVQIAALRRALGAHQSLVQNLPGRGYRFAGEVLGQAGTAPETPPDNPALPLKTMVGRDAELAELHALLSQTRLLTLIGPGGVGKTHLASVLWQGARPRFTGGVYAIDFAPLVDEALVESTVLAALGLQCAESGAAAATIAAALKEQPALLLFDNCEHLLGGVAALADELLRRGAISIVATSQEPLRVSGETIYRLDPLAVPPPGVFDPYELERFSAVALFARCASASDRHFHLSPGNGAMVAEICRSLDGIPLALEMAAARAASLGIDGLRGRLTQRLRVLTTGARNAAARHQTLRHTVAWSYDLLEPFDRAVFRRLGIFAGGFTAGAVAAVIVPAPADEWGVVDALSRLIDKSMVAVGAGEQPRYRLLETLRLFALEKLADDDEHDVVAARHAAYFQQLIDDAYDAWETTEDQAWLACVSPERDNVRAALDWALVAEGGQARAVALAGSAALLWEKISLLAEGRRYLERAEALLTPATPPPAAARLHRQIGNLWHSSDRPRALAALERAEALYRGLDDHAGLSAVLALLGAVRGFMGAKEQAAAALAEARLLLRCAGRPKSLFNVLNGLGVAAALSDDLLAARDYFEEALSTAQSFGAPDREALILINLAEVAFILGDLEGAAERGIAAVERLRGLDDKSDLDWALVNLTAYLLILERRSEAARTAREALQMVSESGGHILRVCLQQWALLAAAAEPAEAARLMGFVDAGFDVAGETRQHAEQRVYDVLRARLELGLPGPALARSILEGATWSESHAVKRAYAVQANCLSPQSPSGPERRP